jgi:hypothetical protein
MGEAIEEAFHANYKAAGACLAKNVQHISGSTPNL